MVVMCVSADAFLEIARTHSRGRTHLARNRLSSLSSLSFFFFFVSFFVRVTTRQKHTSIITITSINQSQENIERRRKEREERNTNKKTTMMKRKPHSDSSERDDEDKGTATTTTTTTKEGPGSTHATDAAMLRTVLVSAASILVLPVIALFVVWRLMEDAVGVERTTAQTVGAAVAIAIAIIAQLRFLFRVLF
jgi:hypothetical protein